MGDRPCTLLLPDGSTCGYVAVDDPSEYTSPPGTRLSNHKNKVHGKVADRVEAPVAAVVEPQASDMPDGTGPFAGAVASGEVPPAPGGGGNGSAGVEPPARAGGLWARWKGRKDPKPDAPAPGRKTRENVPKPVRGYGKGGRLSAAKDIGDLWGWGGGQLQRIGHVPTGRMIRFQAPVAGEMLDEVLSGTMLDKVVVQRAVGVRGKIDLLVAIFGPTILTFRLEQAIAANAPPAAIENLQYMLRETIRNSVPAMIPAMKKVRKRTAAENAAMAEMLDEEDMAQLGIEVDDKGVPRGPDGREVDVADVFVNMLFTDWEPPPVTVQVPQPEENVT